MDLWIVVSGIAVVVFAFVRVAERFLGDGKKMEAIRNRLREAHKKGRVEEDLLLEATTEMNKILLRRLLISVPVLIPILWVASLGEIDTPLGTMGAIWWYLITYLIISGGVAVGSALQKKAKTGGS